MRRDLETFLHFFCKFYSRFPDNVFDPITINSPLLVLVSPFPFICRCSIEDGRKMWIPQASVLTTELICDIAKLDEMYFASNYFDLYRLDFCTVVSLPPLPQ